MQTGHHLHRHFIDCGRHQAGTHIVNTGSGPVAFAYVDPILITSGEPVPVADFDRLYFRCGRVPHEITFATFTPRTLAPGDVMRTTEAEAGLLLIAAAGDADKGKIHIGLQP